MPAEVGRWRSIEGETGQVTLESLSAEAQLLLLSAGGAGNDAALRALIDDRLDWAKVSWLAEAERAAPVLARRLREASQRPLPHGADALQRLAMVSEFRMLYLEQRLREAMRVIGAAGLRAMPLKGAALAITGYGSFAQRPMSDLDLLVDEAESMAARDALLRAGWQETEEERLTEFYRDHHHLAALEDARGTGVRLELHLALFFRGHPFRISPADLWARSEPVSWGGIPVRVPSAHDQLLHLCLHFAWSHLLTTGAWRTFRDLSMLLRSKRIEWDGFVALARESRGASCCYWTFRLAGAMAGVEVPASVMAALRPPGSEWALARVERHFAYYLLPTELLCPSVSVAHGMWRLGVRPGWSGHGRVRPWSRSEDVAVAFGTERLSRGRLVLNHVRNARGWARYVRAVLAPGAAA